MKREDYDDVRAIYLDAQDLMEVIRNNSDNLDVAILNLIDHIDDYLIVKEEDTRNMIATTRATCDTWDDVIRHSYCAGLLAEAIFYQNTPCTLEIMEGLKKDAIGILNSLDKF